MKLLIISDAWHPQVNGVVRTYEHLEKHLMDKGHTVKVIGPADFKYTIPMPGYSEIKLALFPYGRIAKIIEEFEPDWLHIATEGPLGWAARKYCLRNNRDFTTSYHTHFPDYVAKRVGRFLPFLYRPSHELAKRHVRRFHAPARAMMIATQSLEDELKSWGFKPKMKRLTRGADLSLFTPGPKTLFQNLPGPVALYVGRVAVEKNLDDFLNMEWTGTKVIVGDGPCREELQKAYPDAHFAGTKLGAELAEHYRSADLFVFPSRTDTFGMVLVEALACGLPVAAYNVTGPKDIITEPFLGALHETDLAWASRKAMENGTAEERARHVREYFTWEAAGEQFERALVKRPFIKVDQ